MSYLFYHSTAYHPVSADWEPHKVFLQQVSPGKDLVTGIAGKEGQVTEKFREEEDSILKPQKPLPEAIYCPWLLSSFGSY